MKISVKIFNFFRRTLNDRTPIIVQCSSIEAQECSFLSTETGQMATLLNKSDLWLTIFPALCKRWTSQVYKDITMNKFCSFSRLQWTIRDQEGFLHLFSGSLVINVLIFLLACDEILKAIIHEALNLQWSCWDKNCQSISSFYWNLS